MCLGAISRSVKQPCELAGKRIYGQDFEFMNRIEFIHKAELSSRNIFRAYHPRSNIESTFSMIKRKFGDSVRSKGDLAMKNEVLAKVLCHNLFFFVHLSGRV